jgi:hypothetical protein
VGHVIKALTDTFHGVGTGRNVEQALIGVGILHDSRSGFSLPSISPTVNTRGRWLK